MVDIISEITDEGKCMYIKYIAAIKVRENNTIEKYLMFIERPKSPTIVMKSSKKLLTNIERTNNNIW